MAGRHGSREIQLLALGLIGLCLVQYLLGMALNLFVVISRHHPGSSGDDFFERSFQSVWWGLTHGGYVAFHAGLGIVLVLSSIRLAVTTFTVSQPRVRAVGVVEALAILGAAFNGAAFLDFNLNLNSMYMATFLAIALSCYSWMLFRSASTPHTVLPDGGDGHPS
ncbi:MAG: hypothetical protein ACRENX_04665 [Candidatus Dormibacteria bacterium]